MTRISFLNNQFIDHDQAFIHIEDRGFQFADSVYEVILFRNNQLVDIKPHLNRLFRSLKEISINHNFIQDEIEKNAYELLKRNNISDGSVYIQISRGRFNRLQNIPPNLEPTFIMTAMKAKNFSQEDFEKGLKLMSHDDIRWGRVDIKTTGLLASTMVNQKAKDLGFDDALFLRDKIVTEATYSNFFMVDENDVLITKPADERILNGITRQRILKIAKENNIKFIEKDFSLDQVFKAKEAFLSSSTLMIRPVVLIDNNKIFDGKVGEITQKLSGLYKDFIFSNKN